MKKYKFIAGLTALAVSFGVTQLSCAFSTGVINPVTANAELITNEVIYSGITDDGFAYDVFGSYDYIYDDTVGDFVRKNIKYDYVSITGYNGDDPVVTVPNTIDGCIVAKLNKTFLKFKLFIIVIIL